MPSFRANDVPGFENGQFGSGNQLPNGGSTEPGWNNGNSAQAGFNAATFFGGPAGTAATGLYGLLQGLFPQTFPAAQDTGDGVENVAGTAGHLQNFGSRIGSWISGNPNPNATARSNFSDWLDNALARSPQDGGAAYRANNPEVNQFLTPMGSLGYSMSPSYQIGTRNEPDYGNMSLNPGAMTDFGSQQAQPSYQIGLRNEPTYAPMQINPGPMPDYGLPEVGGMDNGRSRSVQAQQNAIIDLQSGRYANTPLHFDNTQMGWEGPALQNLGGADAYNSIGMTPFAAFGSPDNGGQGSGPSAEDVKRWAALNSTGNQWLD